MFGWLICKIASSANKLVLKLNSFGKSFTYNKNNIGPSTEPCGIPNDTL